VSLLPPPTTAHHAASSWQDLGCVVRHLPLGPIAGLRDRTGAPASRAIVLEGVVLQHVSLLGRTATEVLSAGDALVLLDGGDGGLLGASMWFEVHVAATLAVPPDAPGPELTTLLEERHAERCRRASTHGAILQLPRIEDRVLAVFCELAERIGRVTPEGIVVDLPLTHRVVGCLVGGRRPTVSLALGQLAQTRVLVRRSDGAWVLSRTVADGAVALLSSPPVVSTPGPRPLAA
jgi:CRP/FNR family transcriptional regulator, cyclic AMP receptor protein